MDPAAEKFYGLSPYNSLGNKPISHIDPRRRFIFETLLGPILGFARGITRLVNSC